MPESINLVLYSHGEPFNSTKIKLIETINKFTNRNVIIHDYDLDRIMKSFIVNEVYENMNDSDILYYVDSSRYFKYGFTENVDKLCDIVLDL